ncbi:PLP-dependent aminotransferase family protein [Pseudonocardia alaniniphila]|uniref:PLP-dependent aminotransferase family protein n=1 Tax=Pseudonocardia alaniniphila TaxID=75291 RepID=A0ABS9TK65_9PSEU|nr:PLP-dependent aminotransferase family protein [Pseudonocardia alaniniphila]MCH6168937.1 PLP-dependent aminotransferase family protein [Pseudonocardia alaniniphila]
MGNSWVNLAEELGAAVHVELARPGSRRAALIRALREAVRSGRLAPGTRLPPYRAVAAELGLARNTVADAYAELVAEGWLTARQGAGTQVAHRAQAVGPPPVHPPARTVRALPLHNLEQGQPDASSFPRRAWLASARRALMDAPNDAFGPGDPRGRIELREALAEYLARARGVRTTPERLVVCSGFSHALRLLFDGVLSGPLAVESYGLAYHRALLAAASVRTVPLTLDENGARIDELARHDQVRAVLLTPAHQFPTGGPLAPARRPAVLDWARSRGGMLVEDDYDGEFRYDRQPVGALQGLDPDHVVYVGSVSTSLSPALRLGWMALPDQLVDPVLAAKGEREGWANVLAQLTLAHFISSGAYDRHIRRMRQRYRRRRDQLVTAVAERHLQPTGIAAGLHVALRLPPGTEQTLVESATAAGIALDGLAAFRHPDATVAPTDGLVVGYAAPSDHAYGPALDALCRVLADHT